MTKRGAFIVLEGIDGAGTSTQLNRIAWALLTDEQAPVRIGGLAMYRMNHPRKFFFTAEPSDGTVGRFIRAMLTREVRLPGDSVPSTLTWAELYAMDRENHWRTAINPELSAGRHVICTRWVLSSLVYQGQSVDMDQLQERFPAADLTLYLKVNPNVAAERRRDARRVDDVFEADGEKQRKVALDYERVIDGPWGRREHVVTVDGTLPTADVTVECLRHIRALLDQKTHATP